MTKITLTNDFHDTTAVLRALDVYSGGHIAGPPAYQKVSIRAWRAAMRKLCPFNDCQCGRLKIDGRAPRHETVYVNGRVDHVRI